MEKSEEQDNSILEGLSDIISNINSPEKESYENSDFSRLIIHIDMDAYYAQVEMKKHGIQSS